MYGCLQTRPELQGDITFTRFGNAALNSLTMAVTADEEVVASMTIGFTKLYKLSTLCKSTKSSILISPLVARTANT
jgi:hypothetical protein